MALAWRASASQQIVGEIGLDLRGEKAVLGEEMAAALAPLRHVGAARRIEEHHRLGGERAALGGAEGERIDAGLPGRLRGRGVHARQRVAEPRAVDMHGEPARMRDLGELAISSGR